MYRTIPLNARRNPARTTLPSRPRTQSYLRLLLPVVLATIAITVFGAAGAHAADIGSGNCTFGDLQTAVASGVANFTADCTITMTDQITVTNDLTVTGNGFDVILSGDGGHRLFDIAGELEPGERTVIVDGVILQNGDMPKVDDANKNGGAIAVRASMHMTAGTTSLVIRNSTLRNNSTAEGVGGAISLRRSAFPEGAVPNLVVQNSTIAGNTAGTITPTTGGGIYCDNCTMTITNTSIVRNTANGDLGGGGIFFTGDALVAELTNSTLSGNISSRGAGFATPTFATSLAITLTNVTIAANDGTGFTHDGNGSVNAINTLITNNTGVTDLGAAGINGVSTTNSVVATTPDLGPLADNGGNTQTHAISAFSTNAINQGTDVGSLPAYDQRGAPFLRSVGSAVDIGAYEFPVFGSDMSIVKSVIPSGPVHPGQSITYSFSFINTGVTKASSVVITDVVPISVIPLDVVSSTVGAGVMITDTGIVPPFVWTVSDLATGEGGAITITGQISTTLSTETVFTNTVTVDSTDDPVSANNVGEAPLTVVVPRASFSAASYRAGEGDTSAIISVTLDGPNPHAPVQVTYNADPGTTGQVTIAAGAVTGTFSVPIGNDSIVEPDKVILLSLSDPMGAALGPIANATLTIVEDDRAGLRAAKSASLDTAQPGDVVTYTYRVTNTGNVNLTSITAVDDKLGTISLSPGNLIPDQVATGIATYTVQQSDLPGPLANTVTVTATGGGVTVTGSDGVSVSLTGTASLSMSKTPNRDNAYPDDIVTYTYRVTNTGNVNLTTIIAVDDKLGPITFTPGNLMPDQAATAIAAYSVQQGDLPGPLTNTVTVTATGGSLTVIGIVSASVTVSESPANTGNVQGTVVDENGNGIENATVFLSDKMGVLRMEITGPDGTYAFNNVPVGTYTLAVEADGYQMSIPVLVTVTEDGTHIVEQIVLFPEQGSRTPLYLPVVANSLPAGHLEPIRRLFVPALVR